MGDWFEGDWFEERVQAGTEDAAERYGLRVEDIEDWLADNITAENSGATPTEDIEKAARALTSCREARRGANADSARLRIELVPRALWGKSLAKQKPRREWDTIRRAIYARAGGRCAACGDSTDRLICHEVWDYDDERHTARLVELKGICPNCNLTTHYGRAINIGREEEAFDHLLSVNGWTAEETEAYVEDAFEKWQERSEHSWTLDASELPRLLR
jgi:hypothetical protein